MKPTSNRRRMNVSQALKLAAVVGLIAFAGCATRERTTSNSILRESEGSVVYGAFVPQGEAKLAPPSPVIDMYAVGDALYVYTERNTVYGMSQGLDIRFVKQIVSTEESLRPPVQVGEEVIFPTTAGLFVTTKDGVDVRTIKLQNPLSSDIHVDQRGLLLAGTASDTGGRVSMLDPTRNVRPTEQETLIGNVMSAPVAMQGIVFAATDRGRVYAIGGENRAAWPLEGMSFDTGRPIEADLVIDDYALYVASTDLKLYALDRTNGKIKWRFAAEVPLRNSPFVTKDRVYQVVEGRGLAAIDKLEGKLYREPLWMAEGVTKVITADDRYIYGAQGDDRIVALDIATGEIRFSATGNFDFVTAGTDGIFAASRNGNVVKLKRGPYAGEPAVAAGQ